MVGTEANLSGLQVGNTKYKVPTSTTVVANPTLVGTETNLTGIEIGGVKYKVPDEVGTKLYMHTITIGSDTVKAVSKDATAYTNAAAIISAWNLCHILNASLVTTGATPVRKTIMQISRHGDTSTGCDIRYVFNNAFATDELIAEPAVEDVVTTL